MHSEMLIIQLRDIESKYFTRRNASSSFLSLFKAYHAECYFNYTLRFNRVGENVPSCFAMIVGQIVVSFRNE